MLSNKESAFTREKAPACAPHPETVETLRVQLLPGGMPRKKDEGRIKRGIQEVFEQQGNEKTACARLNRLRRN